MTRFDLTETAFCELHEAFLAADEADATFQILLSELPWEARAIFVFGREVMQPRLVAWIGDADAVYTYSGARHEPLPWHPALRGLAERIGCALDRSFNSVLCNLYRDGRDSMGMHSDSEPELGAAPLIASVSLGATRKFQLRARSKGNLTEKLDLPLSHGSLLVMGGEIQRQYRHGVPKQPAVSTPRINLTFRRIDPHQR